MYFSKVEILVLEVEGGLSTRLGVHTHIYILNMHGSKNVPLKFMLICKCTSECGCVLRISAPATVSTKLNYILRLAYNSAYTHSCPWLIIFS